jgi:hypothetical protein
VLRLYWFSQTIAAGRGLEETIKAIAAAGITATLTLRGRPQDGYLATLDALAAGCGARVTIRHEPPAAPDAMVDLARGHDVGLAIEQPLSRNRQLCLPNKTFTYILAGLAVAISDLPGQHALGVDLAPGGALVPPTDVAALAAVLAGWAEDPAALGTRPPGGVAGGQPPLALGARARSRTPSRRRAPSRCMKILLIMDPYIRVPPQHYGGIERVIADLAEGLSRAGHDITLWAAPGSQVAGRVRPFGSEGEWTRWSNLRNTLTLASRFVATTHRFDVGAQLRTLGLPGAHPAAQRSQGADLHAEGESTQHDRRDATRRQAAALHRRSARGCATREFRAAATGRLSTTAPSPSDIRSSLAPTRRAHRWYFSAVSSDVKACITRLPLRRGSAAA